MADFAFLFLVLNTASTILVLSWEFAKKGGYLSLPFLVSLIFLTWYLPQAWKLLDASWLSMSSLARLLLMSLLCFWAMIIGWHKGRGKGMRVEPMNLPVARLLVPVYLITFLALATHLLIEMQPPEVRLSGQWTGTITIIAFFASTGVVSLVLSTAMILNSRTASTIILFLLNLLIYVPLITIYFRRADTFEFALAIGLGLFFIRAKVLPRPLLVVFAIFAFFFVNGVGQLRALSGAYSLSASGSIEAKIPTLREIAEIDWLAAVDQNSRVQESEVTNAVMGMESVAGQGNFTFGGQFWNRLVFAYVPAQLLGREFKESLIVGEHSLETAHRTAQFDPKVGVTWTGFLDPYQDFWFFGSFVWCLTGFVMGLLFRHAASGSVVAYTLYAATITNAIHVTTHFGYYLFTQSLLIFVAVMFVRAWIVNIPRARGKTSRVAAV